MNIETTMALMAAGSYWDVRRGALNPTTGVDTDNDAPIPPGWKVLTQYDISGSGSNSSILSDGFSARVYQNITTNEIVISYAGTEFGLDRSGFYDDFINGNIPSALGRYGQQAYLAADLYQRVKADTTLSDNISFTGHSLGGGLASMMAVWYDRPAYVFAPAPFERSVDSSQILGPQILTGVMTRVKARLLLGSGGIDPAFLGYNPLTDFSTREAKVKAWAIKGEVLEDGLTRFSPGIVDWIEAPGRVSLFKDSTNKLSPGDKHSIDLHAAALLSDKFQTEAGKLPTALERLMDKNLYGGDVLGNRQVIVTKLVRNEVGVRDESDGQVLLAANDMLTHFANDLGKLGANMAGLNQAAQDAILAQGIEWYYWQGNDYAGQEFFNQTGELLQYTSAQDGVLAIALNKAVTYLNTWLTPMYNAHGEFGGRVSFDQWSVAAGSTGSTAAARDATKTQIFIGGGGADTFTGGNAGDVILAGDGADTLNGGEGSDHLYGGAGNDVYKFTGTFGGDVVIDSDGEGSIQVDGVTLQGGKKLNDNSWYNQEQGFVFALLGSGANKSLLIRKDSSYNFIRVQGWQNGQLGLTMDGALAELPEAALNFTGDQHGAIITDPETGHQSYDWNGTTWTSDGTLAGGVVETDYRDVIIGSNDADKISGLGGNDALVGGGGNDEIDGGDGNDLIGGGAGSDTIKGGEGNDTILSATGLNVFQRKDPTSEWDPTLAANGGSLAYDDAPDVIDAGAGNDTVYAGRGNDRIDGGTGVDVLYGGVGNDIIEGGSDGDTLVGDGTKTPNTYGSVAGADHGNDFLDGGAGDDGLIGGGKDDTLFGGAGNDLMQGDDVESELAGEYHGNDYLNGEGGNDRMAGGGKDDELYGGSGNDVLNGDNTQDLLAGEFPSFESAQHIRASLAEGKVPATCTGCREIATSMTQAA